MSPLVSVIVTSYNHAKYIVRALDSVFSQTYKNLEVIVVDDASTDDSQEIIKEYQRKHEFQFIDRKENYFSNSTSQEENPGIEAILSSKGKYIAVVDSDDFIYPDKIAMQVAIMEDNESAVLCYGGIDVMNEDGSRHEYKGNYKDKFLSGDLFEPLLTYGNHILFIGTLIRKSAFIEIEKPAKGLMQVDWDVFLKLAKKGPFIADKRTVACYCRHGSNTWYRADKETLMYKNRMMILDCWMDEDAWPTAMNIRWTRYMQNRSLDQNAIDSLLIERPKDALLHFLKCKACVDDKNYIDAEKHLSLSIEYCDDRLAVLPDLYRLKENFIKDERAKLSHAEELRRRLQSAQVLRAHK